MSTTLAFREDLDLTINDLAEQFGGAGDSTTESINLDRVRVNAAADSPSLSLSKDVEVPLTKQGMTALSDSLQIPAPFFKRLGEMGGVEEQGKLLTTMLNYTKETGMVAEYTEHGLVDLYSPNALRVSPRQVVSTVSRVLESGDSPVQRLVNTPAEFAFDVHVPIDSKKGVGGDAGAEQMPEDLMGYSWASKSTITDLSKVGDLTCAGMRVSLDRKRNLAPSIQPWMMRLACTNGMETTTNMTKIDARGKTVDEVMVEMEYMARLAFERVEAEIEHFYDMRNVEVANPERRLRAIARERNIPDRSLMRMLDVAPEALGSRTTEFDIACLISNFGNHPSTRNDGGRRILEGAAGTTVTDHSVRCGSCNHTLMD